MRRNFNQIFRSVRVRRAKKCDHRFINAALVNARIRRGEIISFIQHIRQPRPSVLHRLPQPHQLSRYGRSLGAAQPHNPDASASRRR